MRTGKEGAAAATVRDPGGGFEAPDGRGSLSGRPNFEGDSEARAAPYHTLGPACVSARVCRAGRPGARKHRKRPPSEARPGHLISREWREGANLKAPCTLPRSRPT